TVRAGLHDVRTCARRPHQPRAEEPLMADLCFENVSMTYRTSSSRGDVVAVSEVSRDLLAGATLGIAGESGSGKTTLITSALRLLPKSARLDGRVLLGGKDLSQLNFGQIRAVRWSQASIVF